MIKLILASNSPRRKDILEKFGYSFIVESSEFKECGETENPIETVLDFAKGKAADVYSRLKRKGENGVTVIGADTVVFFNGKILGKPKDRADAIKTLTALSGKTHAVFTGYAVLSDKICVFGYDESQVKFNVLTESLIEEYVSTGKPLDKAGSYGAQDGFPIINFIKGSVYNVIGLPIEKMKPVLDGVLEDKYINIIKN